MYYCTHFALWNCAIKLQGEESSGGRHLWSSCNQEYTKVSFLWITQTMSLSTHDQHIIHRTCLFKRSHWCYASPTLSLVKQSIEVQCNYLSLKLSIPSFNNNEEFWRANSWISYVHTSKFCGSAIEKPCVLYCLSYGEGMVSKFKILLLVRNINAWKTKLVPKLYQTLKRSHIKLTALKFTLMVNQYMNKLSDHLGPWLQ